MIFSMLYEHWMTMMNVDVFFSRFCSLVIFNACDRFRVSSCCLLKVIRFGVRCVWSLDRVWQSARNGQPSQPAPQKPIRIICQTEYQSLRISILFDKFYVPEKRREKKNRKSPGELEFLRWSGQLLPNNIMSAKAVLFYDKQI